MPLKDPVKRRAYERERCARNREKIRIRMKLWRAQNREKIRAYDRGWKRSRRPADREVDCPGLGGIEAVRSADGEVRLYRCGSCGEKRWVRGEPPVCPYRCRVCRDSEKKPR